MRRVTGKLVAVMQPYFFPYGGYFSLMRRVDHFVFFDCVQFPRRGWVHRNKVPGPGSAGEEWLTLPLAAQPREVRICDLEFADNGPALLAQRLSRYGWLGRAEGKAAANIRRILLEIGPCVRPRDLIVQSAKTCAAEISATCTFSLSSELNINPALRAQDRIIEILRRIGATGYVNLSGGRALYDGSSFRRAGLELSFMRPYQGSFASLLPRLCLEDRSIVAAEVASNAVSEP